MAQQVMVTPVYDMWVPLAGLQESQTQPETLTMSFPMNTLGEMQDMSGAAVHHLVLFKNLTKYYQNVKLKVWHQPAFPKKTHVERDFITKLP